MYTEEFLKLPMQEIANMLIEKWNDDKDHVGCLVDGLTDDSEPVYLSVILSKKPVKTIEFEEGELDE